jgi:hypothetical protein
VIKSGRMKWMRHVAGIGKIRYYTKFWLVNIKGTDHSEDIVVDGRIILEWIAGKWGRNLWTRCI